MLTCPITDTAILDLQHDKKTIRYKFSFDQNKFHEIVFCNQCFDKISKFEKVPAKMYGHILKGLLINKTIELNADVYHWESEHRIAKFDLDLKKEIDSKPYPKTPKEKLENLFKDLYQMQSVEGTMFSLADNQLSYYRFYFQNREELAFYLDTLKAEGIITIAARSPDFKIQFTYAGLSKYVSLFEQGYNSTKCFIAMAFEPATKNIRESIRNAVTATGFVPVFVDEENVDSDKTINDFIIARLRESKFCIADFTGHKFGVYFESGFALGQGKNVIYTCREDEFPKAHFDIKPLQHIIYKTPEELQKRLIDKIEAWIK